MGSKVFLVERRKCLVGDFDLSISCRNTTESPFALQWSDSLFDDLRAPTWQGYILIF